MYLLSKIQITDVINIIIIIAFGLGILSIHQSNKQIKISNKQVLFDNRH